MPYKANPFLERMSERSTSDQDFVRLFSPKVIERLPAEAFDGALHVFRSPPGGGKTTLLRAFTPTALRAFWNARRSSDMSESHQRLVALGMVDEQDGPQLLGVMISCASGYADLPPGISSLQEGLFRALFDCRVVLRAIRNLALLLGVESPEELRDVSLRFEAPALDLKHIPLNLGPSDLAHWAEQCERSVYSRLDSFHHHTSSDVLTHVRFESVLWLQGVRFIRNGQIIPMKRMLMIDDVQRLRRKQRAMLLDELVELRPRLSVWLAERSIALGEELLTQGARDGRDVRYYPLEELWTTGGRHHQFVAFAQNVLDRRLSLQNQIPAGAFSQYLRSVFQAGEANRWLDDGLTRLAQELEPFRARLRYSDWLSRADAQLAEGTYDSLRDLYITRILIARDFSRQQLTLELAPLSGAELEARDNSQVQTAAEVFMHEELGIPHYFGIDRLCALATGNIEELLVLAADLYQAVVARQVLRRSELHLSPAEQEKVLVAAARKRRDFIPKAHTEGARAQRLLDAIGEFCRSRTFLPNAPYAPGVTGIRLSQSELARLTASTGAVAEHHKVLRTVIAECVAENLLLARPSAASTSRDSGTVFYLNRALCALYGLPLQMGGWQDVTTDDLTDWLGPRRATKRQQKLGIQ